MPTRLRDIAEQWQSRAAELTRWTTEHLVNRTDRWESYLPFRKRKEGVESATTEGQLTQKIVTGHFATNKPGQLIAVCGDNGDIDPASRWLCVHMLRLGDDDPVRPGQNFQAMLEWHERLHDLGFDPVLEDTDGAGSYRLLVLFDAPTDTKQITEFGQMLVADYADQELLNPPRLVPHPDDTDEHGTIDYIRLPGLHHTLEHYSAIWNGSAWLEGDDAIDALLAARATPSEFMRTPRLRPKKTVFVPEPDKAQNEAMTLPLAMHESEAAEHAQPRQPDQPQAAPPIEPQPAPAPEPVAADQPSTRPEPPTHDEHAPLTSDPERLDDVAVCIAAISRRTGVRESEVIKRVFHWLARQEELVQAVVLGQTPESAHPDIKRRLLEQQDR